MSATAYGGRDHRFKTHPRVLAFATVVVLATGTMPVDPLQVTVLTKEVTKMTVHWLTGQRPPCRGCGDSKGEKGIKELSVTSVPGWYA
jgi:hypothetical protein